jgi:4-diphosphocytidyl-2-C-methyl-D-erythritol kinase
MERSTLTWNWDSAWPAPAKLNLFLHVVGRRADGYHLLQTVFRFIDLADTLRFGPRADGKIVLATPTPGVPPEQDLVVRAALALCEAAKVGAGGTVREPVPAPTFGGGSPQRPEPKVGTDKAPALQGGRAKNALLAVADGGTARTFSGVTIELEKRIPMGGGLGGGSSDAATVLVALNRLWGCGLSRGELQAIGLKLGADVPIFVHGHTAFAEGVGEEFTDVAAPAEWYLLTMPAVAVPTLEIFRSPSLRRDTPAIAPADWRPGFGGNDLEPVACALYPEVARHLAWLRNHGAARMTGSGACCFVPCASEAAARAVQAQLPDGMRGLVVCGLQEHPLCGLT